MPTGNTSLLGLALPVNGELNGTWGTVVNTSITELVDSAVAGTTTLSADADVTLTDTALAANQARQAVILWTASNGATTRNITAPARSKAYIVVNAGTGSVVLRGAGPTTGVTIVSGERCLAAWNGSDFVKIATSTADGVTTFSAGTTGFTPSTATSGAVTLAGTLATTNGGTGLTSFTSGGVVYASSTSALTTGSALTFDGTNLGVGIASAATRLHAVGDNVPFRGQASLQTLTASNFAQLTFYDRTTLGARIFQGYGGTNGVGDLTIETVTSGSNLMFGISGSEQMRLTSTGLGIGTSSPGYRLHVLSASGYTSAFRASTAATTGILVGNTAGDTSIQTLASGDSLIGSDSGKYLAFGTNGFVERMRLDSAGNLGLGVTPSGWNIGKAMQIGTAGDLSLLGFSNSAYIGANTFFNGGWIYAATAAAGRYQINAGAHSWHIAPSGTAGNAISFTQAMTLDASGNLGIGTTSPGTRFQVNQSADGSGITLSAGFRGASRVEWEMSGASNEACSFLHNNGTNKFVMQTMSRDNLQFHTNNTERARFNSAGFLGLGTNSPVAMFDLAGDYKEGVVTANTGTAYTINTATGTLQILTLTGNCTFTFPALVSGESFTLLLRQDGTGSRTVTWPAAVRWPGGTAPTITATANQTDKYVFTSDGTRWYGSNAGQAYAA